MEGYRCSACNESTGLGNSKTLCDKCQVKYDALIRAGRYPEGLIDEAKDPKYFTPELYGFICSESRFIKGLIKGCADETAPQHFLKELNKRIQGKIEQANGRALADQNRSTPEVQRKIRAALDGIDRLTHW